MRLHQAQHHQGTPEESISYVTEKPSQSAEGDSNMHDTPTFDFSHAYNMRERGKSRPLNAWPSGSHYGTPCNLLLQSKLRQFSAASLCASLLQPMRSLLAAGAMQRAVVGSLAASARILYP